MLIKEVKGGINVGVLNASVKPIDTAEYAYTEIEQVEYDAILVEFAQREIEPTE